MTEETIKSREPELTKKGFVRVIQFDFVFFVVAISIFCFLAVVLFFLSFLSFSKDVKGTVTFLIAGAVMVWFSFSVWKGNYSPWRKFRRQMKKWFEDKKINAFIALCPLTYGFKPHTVFKDDFKNLKQLLTVLRKAGVVYIGAPWSADRYTKVVRDEISFLHGVSKEGDLRLKNEKKQLELECAVEVKTIEAENKLLDSLRTNFYPLSP